MKITDPDGNSIEVGEILTLYVNSPSDDQYAVVRLSVDQATQS